MELAREALSLEDAPKTAGHEQPGPAVVVSPRPERVARGQGACGSERPKGAGRSRRAGTSAAHHRIAVVGMLYEDVGWTLVAIPAPDELASEPDIMQIYSEILASQARPFFTTAKRAYWACAQNAIRPDTMRHWSRFCAGRADQLPQVAVVGPVEGETEVHVMADE